MKYLAVIALGLLTACGGEDKKSADEPKKDEPLTQSKNSDTFNQSFTNLLNNYYTLKDAFVSSNAETATATAKALSISADSVSLKELKADKSIVDMAEGYLKLVSSNAKALADEKDLEAKRKAFQSISDNMYDLVRTVQFDRQVVYHQFCPMAFNDAGAYWLSQSSDIKNPYFGKKMLTCGEVKDSIDLRGR